MEIKYKASVRPQEEMLVRSIVSFIRNHAVASVCRTLQFNRQVKSYGSTGTTSMGCGVYRSDKMLYISINLAQIGAGSAKGGCRKTPVSFKEWQQHHAHVLDEIASKYATHEQAVAA